MAYKRKYQKGEPIRSLDELYAQDFVYWRDKITPHGWVAGWQIQMAVSALNGGVICRAIKIQEEQNG